TDRVSYDNRPDLAQHKRTVPPQDRILQVIASRDTREDWLAYFTPGDVVTPALFHLMASVNAWLRGLASPRLDWDAKRRRAVTTVVPSSLLGALWLQFHLAITGKKNYRQCAVCGTWFEISPKVNREAKLFCGDGCRSQAYRNRQKRAQQLHEEGKSFSDI